MNPVFFAYSGRTNVISYAAPSAIVVAGRENRNHPDFQIARDRGAELLAYIDIPEIPTTPAGPLDAEFYADPQYWTPRRENWPTYFLADMRAGSDWIKRAVEYVRSIVRAGKHDGMFLDVVSSRLWTARVGWTNWPVSEQQAWADGQVDLVRRLREMVNQENERFILVSNGVWTNDTRGEQYVNGVCIEGPTVTAAGTPAPFHTNYAGKNFGVPLQRRVIVIADDVVQAGLWSQVSGVTHITATTVYKNPAPAVVPYTDNRLIEEKAYNGVLQQRNIGLGLEVGSLRQQTAIQGNIILGLESKIASIRDIVT